VGGEDPSGHDGDDTLLGLMADVTVGANAAIGPGFGWLESMFDTRPIFASEEAILRTYINVPSGIHIGVVSDGSGDWGQTPHDANHTIRMNSGCFKSGTYAPPWAYLLLGTEAPECTGTFAHEGTHLWQDMVGVPPGELSGGGPDLAPDTAVISDPGVFVTYFNDHPETQAYLVYNYVRDSLTGVDTSRYTMIHLCLLGNTWPCPEEY
jgi:hypothetical protein